MAEIDDQFEDWRLSIDQFRDASEGRLLALGAEPSKLRGCASSPLEPERELRVLGHHVRRAPWRSVPLDATPCVGVRRRAPCIPLRASP
jgi:hypothetical protein